MDLVEQQHKGIFSVLDEACMNVGKVTDEVFLQGLNGKLAKHAHYTSRKVGNITHTPDFIFDVLCGCLVFQPCSISLNLLCDRLTHETFFFHVSVSFTIKDIYSLSYS